MNYLSGYRMAFEFNGKLYFAGMGSPTATLIEVDPATNECTIAYHNINRARGVANGVHGLLVYDGEILMCLATDNYDGKGTPGGIIVASSDPTAGLGLLASHRRSGRLRRPARRHEDRRPQRRRCVGHHRV